LFSPHGIAIAANGDLLIADSGAGPIRVNLADGSQTPVTSGPPLAVPVGIAIAPNGDLLVADPDCCVRQGATGKGGVIRVNPATGAQTVVSSEGHFRSPAGVAIAANGDLLVVDPDAGAVIRVNPAIPNQPPGQNQTVVSNGNFFARPIGIAITTGGDLLVVDMNCCDGSNGGVIRVDPAIANLPPGFNQTVVAQGGRFSAPFGIAIVPPPDPGDILIANSASANILQVKSRTISPWTWEPTVVSEGDKFDMPFGIAIAAIDDLIVVDREGSVIGVNPTQPPGNNQTVVSSGGKFALPTGIAVGANRQLFVVDPDCCDGTTVG